MKKSSITSYVPDDAGIVPATVEFLASEAGTILRNEVAAMLQDSPEPAVSAVAVLRKKWPFEAVHAALVIGRLQAKGRTKFPQLKYVWVVPEALEQATSFRVAEHKTSRFVKIGAKTVIDYCAGIGGDTLGLMEVGKVVAVDLSATRLKCLELNTLQMPGGNANLKTICAAAQDVSIDGTYHIDPARRSGGKRSARYEDLIPNPDFLFGRERAGAIKLSPAVEFESLPTGHLEIISHNGVVVQAVLWRGPLMNLFPAGTRTATVIGNGPAEVFSFTGMVQEIETLADPQSHQEFFLFETDGAFTRSKLASAFAETLGLTAITTDGGYLLGDRPLNHTALGVFRTHKVFRYSESNVTRALREFPASTEPYPIEVKTRGKLPSVDTDRLQKVFTAANPTGHTVFIFPAQNDVLAIIATRLAH